jgi:hypothetical protein
MALQTPQRGISCAFARGADWTSAPPKAGLACIDDDAQGEVAETLWDAELDGSILGDEGRADLWQHVTDDPKDFSTYAWRYLEYHHGARS